MIENFQKYKAAELAKKWDFDYWDGDRRICYGGYNYIQGRWAGVANSLISHYSLKAGDKILDVGCGKGFLLYEMLLIEPGLQINGLDISEYAIKNCKPEISDYLKQGNANNLPYEDNYFDLVISLNTIHNLYTYDLEKALKEIKRVSKDKKYLCVESYRNERKGKFVLYWQVTCESFYTPEEWEWWFKKTSYDGDHSFIFF